MVPVSTMLYAVFSGTVIYINSDFNLANMCHTVQNVGGVKLWQNFSTNVFEWKNFGKLSKCSITYSLMTMFELKTFGKLIDNCQISSCQRFKLYSIPKTKKILMLFKPGTCLVFEITFVQTCVFVCVCVCLPP